MTLAVQAYVQSMSKMLASIVLVFFDRRIVDVPCAIVHRCYCGSRLIRTCFLLPVSDDYLEGLRVKSFFLRQLLDSLQKECDPEHAPTLPSCRESMKSTYGNSFLALVMT